MTSPGVTARDPLRLAIAASHSLQFGAVNLLSGMTTREEISALFTFLLFNLYVVLEVSALAAFYVTARPRRGRVRSAALWHIAAACVFVMCFITTVWAAPAEKSFINADDPSEPFLAGDRFTKVVVGLGFALVGITFMVIGFARAGAQRRRAAREALLEEPVGAGAH